LSTFTVNAQDTNHINAKITVDSWENSKLNDAEVIYTDLINRISRTETTVLGYCELKLDLNTSFLIEIKHPDYYTKSIEVETDVPRKQLHKSHSLILEILLKKNCDEDPAKAQITADPIGRVKFDKGRKEFQYELKPKLQQIRSVELSLIKAEKNSNMILILRSAWKPDTRKNVS